MPLFFACFFLPLPNPFPIGHHGCQSWHICGSLLSLVPRASLLLFFCKMNHLLLYWQKALVFLLIKCYSHWQCTSVSFTTFRASKRLGSWIVFSVGNWTLRADYPRAPKLFFVFHRKNIGDPQRSFQEISHQNSNSRKGLALNPNNTYISLNSVGIV